MSLQSGLRRKLRDMAIFRKRPDRIRGVAGSLEGMTVVVADGTIGPGPGIVRVLAEAGARVLFSGPNAVSVDLQLRALGNTPHEIGGIVTTANTQEERLRLLAHSERPLDAVVVNASEVAGTAATLGEDSDAEPVTGLTPHDAIALARLAVDNMRDGGREGNVVFVTGIDRGGPAAAALAVLQVEMEELARRVAPNGIRVNAVAPGQVSVNRRGHVVSSRASPLGHVSVHPVEIGKAVWFLVNANLSSGTTGTTLKIDRGASLLRPEW